MKDFALIGVAGYIAPKHLKAIKETGNRLVAALDKFDSVGVLDSYFPETAFFVEFERFDRHIEKLKRTGHKIDYVSICSPNYLHDAHIRFALRVGANAICEKPLVLNPWNVEALMELEQETGLKVNNILQLRLHPSIIALKQRISTQNSSQKHQVTLTYITSRGSWYHSSWKGDSSKSGGIATNIGIHFFDMLIWVFGAVKQLEIKENQAQKVSGILELEKATVEWTLSIDPKDLPAPCQIDGKRTFRSITVDGQEAEFSEGFADLHTMSYQEILKGNGFSCEEVIPSIQLVHDIRNWTK